MSNTRSSSRTSTRSRGTTSNTKVTISPIRNALTRVEDWVKSRGGGALLENINVEKSRQQVSRVIKKVATGSIEAIPTSFLIKLLNITTPFDLSHLKDIRMIILRQMAQKGFNHYVEQMKTLNEYMNEAFEDSDKVVDNDYFSKSICRDSYWYKETPELAKIYDRKKSIFSEPVGITSITTAILSDNAVKQLIGSASWMTVQQVIVFRSLISSYFVNNERLWPVHLNMDLTFLQMRGDIKTESKTNNTNIELIRNIFRAILSGSGTFILKILQQINTSDSGGGDGDGDNNATFRLADIAQDVFTNVPGLSPEELKFITNEFNIPKTYIENMNPQILGSASIAETHKSWNEQYGTVILKFIKPLYAYYYLCECNFLLTETWKKIGKMVNDEFSSPTDRHNYTIQCRKLLMFFIKEFMKEFDYEQEFINTVIGYQVYNKKHVPVKSIIAIERAIDPFPILVLSYAPGKSVAKMLTSSNLSADILKSVYKNVDELIGIWFRNTLWGNGFFHADLHPGNVLIDEADTEALDLILIDYGSCGVLTKRQQCLLVTGMIISGGIKKFLPFNSTGRSSSGRSSSRSSSSQQSIYNHNLKVCDKFVENIWDLCERKNYTPRDVHNMSIKILKVDQSNTYTDLFLRIVKYSDDIGNCVNNPVLLFGRALAYLGDLILVVTEKCNTYSFCPQWKMDGIIKRNLLEHPSQLLNYKWKGNVCGGGGGDGGNNTKHTTKRKPSVKRTKTI